MKNDHHRLILASVSLANQQLQANSYQKSSSAGPVRLLPLKELWSFGSIQGCCCLSRRELLGQTNSPSRRRVDRTRRAHGRSSILERKALQGSLDQSCDSNPVARKLAWAQRARFAKNEVWFHLVNLVLQLRLLTCETEALTRFAAVGSLRGPALNTAHAARDHHVQRRQLHEKCYFRLHQLGLLLWQESSFGLWLSSE